MKDIGNGDSTNIYGRKKMLCLRQVTNIIEIHDPPAVACVSATTTSR